MVIAETTKPIADHGTEEAYTPTDQRAHGFYNPLVRGYGITVDSYFLSLRRVQDPTGDLTWGSSVQGC